MVMRGCRFVSGLSCCHNHCNILCGAWLFDLKKSHFLEHFTMVLKDNSSNIFYHSTIVSATIQFLGYFYHSTIANFSTSQHANSLHLKHTQLETHIQKDM